MLVVIHCYCNLQICNEVISYISKFLLFLSYIYTLYLLNFFVTQLKRSGLDPDLVPVHVDDVDPGAEIVPHAGEVEVEIGAEAVDVEDHGHGVGNDLQGDPTTTSTLNNQIFRIQYTPDYAVT